MKDFEIKTITFSLRALILGVCIAAGSVFAQTLNLSPTLINFNSDEGENLFVKSGSREDFFPLIIQFTTQNNQAYCGVASMVMVLNGLGIPAPEAPQYSPFHVFTQENFFDNEKTQQVVSPEVVSHKGMTLDQLGQLLESYSTKVKVFHSADTTLEEFRKLAAENLK
ncbi:MAG: phytochelatin synthase family protein, partial [Microcystaceae cyanobacterium]